MPKEPTRAPTKTTRPSGSLDFLEKLMTPAPRAVAAALHQAPTPAAANQHHPTPIQRPGTVRTAAELRAALPVGTPSPAATAFLGALSRTHLHEEISDVEARRRATHHAADPAAAQTQAPTRTAAAQRGPDKPRNPQNLPAVLARDLIDPQRRGSLPAVIPRWGEVRHLPGYLSTQIRALGRQVFTPFTDVPIENIHILAELDGRGPNTKTEIDAMAAWIRVNGVRDDEAEITISENLARMNPAFANIAYRPRVHLEAKPEKRKLPSPAGL
jgi:hypothetical protein